jgi:hypothetical protein
MKVATVIVTAATAPNSTAFWDTNAYLMNQYPSLVDSGVFGYIFTGGAISGEVPGSPAALGVYLGEFIAPNMTSVEVEAILAPLMSHINATWPNQWYINATSRDYPDLYQWWQTSSSDIGVGGDFIIASRLVDNATLSQPQSVISQTLQEIIAPGEVANINLIAGPGLWHAVPAGGSDSIHPGWRKAYGELGGTPCRFTRHTLAADAGKQSCRSTSHLSTRQPSKRP